MSEIHWYEAPPGASIYTQPNIFFPLNFTTQLKLTTGVGELATSPRVRTLWGPPGGPDGLAAHGTSNDFMGLTVDDGSTTWADVPSCRVPFDIALQCVLGSLENVSFFAFKVETTPPPTPFAFGVETGAGEFPLAFSVLQGMPQKSWPLGLCAKQGNVPDANAFALGTYYGIPKAGSASLALGSDATKSPGGIGAMPLALVGESGLPSDQGLRLALLTETTSIPQSNSLALKSTQGSGGGISGDVVPLALGIITGDLDTPEPPGTPCSNAGRFGPFGTRSFTVNAGDDLWLFHSIDVDTTYHVSINVTSGSMGTVTIYTGSSCDSTDFSSTFFPGVTCTSFGEFAVSPPKFVWIRLQGGLLGGSFDIDVTLAHGPCP